jgi:hypothetical protein
VPEFLLNAAQTQHEEGNWFIGNESIQAVTKSGLYTTKGERHLKTTIPPLSTLAVLTLTVLTLPAAVLAQHKHTKTAAAPMYECPICHHKADAALAKRLHYICPKDNGRLALVKTANLPHSH